MILQSLFECLESSHTWNCSTVPFELDFWHTFNFLYFGDHRTCPDYTYDEYATRVPVYFLFVDKK